LGNVNDFEGASAKQMPICARDQAQADRKNGSLKLRACVLDCGAAALLLHQRGLFGADHHAQHQWLFMQ
jgi:hypothetical protein